MKETKVNTDTGKEEVVEEKSFFSKYWTYILLALVILPRLFEVPEEPAQGGQGGQQQRAPAAK
eukprot:CAMPEP_0176376900 /NCGR_PEP_ID=MMETSP0126-20121128/28505_1 /TAXON_ID=141414 ORGANISM="Strombidinopsis acuminatum, Strain SPMC142" /NCGR_SAMPLE_ID=MMETSP0126 /ASSEMBLY_ACC=CAM_ASM_000229 /LENGTH=62 /DNA_ID=CAMNT_0017738509 /DNA_START=635 /DNA_END=823 /DNA_ORIENTATION=+